MGPIRNDRGMVLGMTHDMRPCREDPAAGGADQRASNLRREAAHNMALIYKASGADELARRVLRQHFMV